MIDQAAGSKSAGLRLGRRVIHQLRASLERDAGIQAATHLQEAGFAGGEELYNDFTEWLKRTRQVDTPADLDMQYLGTVLGEFFAEQGWGKLSVMPRRCWRSTQTIGPRRWTSPRASTRRAT